MREPRVSRLNQLRRGLGTWFAERLLQISPMLLQRHILLRSLSTLRSRHSVLSLARSQSSSASSPTATMDTCSSACKHKDGLSNLLQSNRCVLVVFVDAWCPACQAGRRPVAGSSRRPVCGGRAAQQPCPRPSCPRRVPSSCYYSFRPSDSPWIRMLRQTDAAAATADSQARRRLPCGVCCTAGSGLLRCVRRTPTSSTAW